MTGAYQGRSMVSTRQVLGDAKVNQLQVPAPVYHAIRRFDIPMDHSDSLEVIRDGEEYGAVELGFIEVRRALAQNTSIFIQNFFIFYFRL